MLSDRRGSAQREKIYIYGKHALTEALLNAPRAVRKVFLSGEAVAGEDGAELRALVKKVGVPAETMRGHNEADRMVGEDTAHQGVIAIVDPGAMMVSFGEFMAKNFGDGKYGKDGRDNSGSHESDGTPAATAKKFPTEKTMLVLLDELTDPHNVGAIIRSAAAFGAAGVLMPSHNQAPITGSVVKASAGMAFRVPLVSIGNVNQTVDALRNDFGFRTYGLAMDGARVLTEESFDAPALVIVGNEGKGIRQKTLERCDVTLRIPMDERTESLNASVSAAVVMYQWSVKHPG